MNKIIPLLLVVLLASSCSFDKPLTFEKQSFTSDDFEDCISNNCPTINVQVLKAPHDDEKSLLVNEAVEKHIMDIIVSARENNEGIVTIREALQSFINDFRKYETEFGNDFLSYDADIFMNVSYQSEQLVSLDVNYYLFTGGAHGYSGTNFLNFDAQTGTKLSHTDLFTDTEAILAHAEKKFRDSYQIPEDRNINATGFWFEKDTFHFPENIGFTENEIVLHYNQYEIASYAEGPITLSIPKQEIAQFLKFQ
ncbi:MAG: DUF3298 domain-containing protein [Flavobacteriaceae bacterium]